jgi:hypothetical protein
MRNGSAAQGRFGKSPVKHLACEHLAFDVSMVELWAMDGRILIVVDDALMRRSLALQSKRAGYRASTAA